jgi:hypothetical protein
MKRVVATFYKKIKKGNDREHSIAALNKQLVSPSRSVAPHYGYTSIMTVILLFKVSPAIENVTHLILLRQNSLSAMVNVVILTQLTLESCASTPSE